jgi:carbon monoxide dehydrogenase subunit G
VEVAAPKAVVFAYLTDPDQIVAYIGPMSRIHRWTAPSFEPGARMTIELRFLGLAVNQRTECTEHEAPTRFAARSVGGRLDFEVGFRLVRVPGGTRIDGWGRARAPVFRLAEPLLSALVERQVDADLRALRDRIQTHHLAPPRG